MIPESKSALATLGFERHVRQPDDLNQQQRSGPVSIAATLFFAPVQANVQMGMARKPLKLTTPWENVILKSGTSEGGSIMTNDSQVAPLPGQVPEVFRPHVPALDGIRGLAILLVMVVHLMTSNSRSGNRFFDFVSAIRGATWTGVDLFLVLSGFLITGILYDSLSSKDYFRNFYARRVLRIFPLYYGFLLLLICLTIPLHLQWHGMQYVLLSYTQNLGIFTKDFTGFTPAPLVNLNHFWSLAVEEQFYLVWPCIVFFVRDARKLILTALVLCSAALALRFVMLAHGASPVEIYVFTGCRADSLMIGGALALTFRTGLRPALLRYSGIAFFVLFAVMACVGGYLGGINKDNYFVASVGYTIIAVAYAALIGTVIARPAWTRIAFENSFMRFFGKYGYGLYVYHVLVGALTTPLRYRIDAASHSKAIGVVLSALIAGALSVVVAFTSYHLYEKHFLKLKKHFEPKACDSWST
jgi:peptidoglycan/LPS O-acetylase OafA/YrhL